MRSSVLVLGAAGLLSASVSAQITGCAYSCLWSQWSNVPSSSTPSYCTNSTTLDAINTCISSTSCSTTDKNAVYATLAQICANAGNPLTTTPEATFSATSGGSVWPTSYSHSNPYSTATPTPTVLTTTDSSGSTTLLTPTPTSTFPFWAPPSGPEWTSGAWSTGPWTSWWNHASATNFPHACPDATWPGWTSGAWSTAAPWTSWHGCSASTTATSVVTTTDRAGMEETSTSFGVVVKAAADTTSSTAAAAATGGVVGGVRAQGGVVGIAVIAAAVLL